MSFGFRVSGFEFRGSNFWFRDTNFALARELDVRGPGDQCLTDIFIKQLAVSRRVLLFLCVFISTTEGSEKVMCLALFSRLRGSCVFKVEG